MSEQLRQIATRLKGLREVEDISKEALAREFNIPIELYEQYESGEVDIPVSFLYEVAEKFGVELTAILTGDNPKLKVYAYVKNGKGLTVDRRKEYEYQNLSYNFSNKKMETFMVTVPPRNDDTAIAENQHPGQEFNYMLEGRLELLINGKSIILEEGDSIHFDSNYPHGMRALDNKKARFLAVITL